MKALSNLEAFHATHYQGESMSIWHRLPISRRSAVFVLLFFGQFGELRVVLTKRSSQLRSFPGHISFPGGKADSGLESEWMVARREMHEEIGLSSNDQDLKKSGLAISHLTQMPCYLSRTFSAVAPCVGLLRMEDASQMIQLAVNPGESSHIFSVPLLDFLYPKKVKGGEDLRGPEALDRTHRKMSWGGIPWNLRSYTFPQTNPAETHWLREMKDLSETEGEEEGEEGEGEGEEEEVEEEEVREETEVSEKKSKSLEKISLENKKKLSSWGNLGSRRDSITNQKLYDVWGLTANILHDVAQVAYAPETMHGAMGEEELIWSVWHYGKQMSTQKRSPEEAALIRSSSPSDASFADILPRSEFLRLKRIYKI